MTHKTNKNYENNMRKPLTKYQRMTIQLWMAVFLVILGCGLLIAGFTVDPLGEIHNSVLIAFGESSTFAGALMGVDYNYKFKRYEIDRHYPPHIEYDENDNNVENQDP